MRMNKDAAATRFADLPITRNNRKTCHHKSQIYNMTTSCAIFKYCFISRLA